MVVFQCIILTRVVNEYLQVTQFSVGTFHCTALTQSAFQWLICTCYLPLYVLMGTVYCIALSD